MRPWLVILAACGGSAAPVIANKPAVEQVSCSDASKVLRGTVTSDDPAAGPARESAILRSCQGDAWSRAVLDCIGTARPPASCIAKLDEAQRESYQAKLDTWDAQYAVAASEPVDESLPAYAVDCAAIPTPENFAPKLDTGGAEHDWQVKNREPLIRKACTHDWTEPDKQCVATGDIDACMTMGMDFQPLIDQLTEVDVTAKKIVVARMQPKAITCEKAVAAHYGDAKWRDKLKGDKDRAKQIARSRKEMQAACVAEPWSEQQRACIVVADSPMCYGGELVALRFGYPATSNAGIWAKLPFECQMYGAAMERITTRCMSTPQTTRDAMRASFDQLAQTWSQLPANEMADLKDGCEAAAKSLIDAFKTCSSW